jgi:RNA polymerase sigma-70 factor (ECF subfamily)
MEEENKQLYKLFFNGENNAVKEVVMRFREELILFVNCYLHDLNQAEDIASETFVKIILKKPKLRNEKHFKTYIYKIAKNLAIDYVRRKKIESEFCKNYQAPIDEDVCEKEEKEKLCKAISKLKKEYRLIIYLRYYDDFTIEEIAKIVKKNKKYVYNVINRAKNELKVLLKEDVEDERY